jgi:hypothetical protein
MLPFRASSFRHFGGSTLLSGRVFTVVLAQAHCCPGNLSCVLAKHCFAFETSVMANAGLEISDTETRRHIRRPRVGGDLFAVEIGDNIDRCSEVPAFAHCCPEKSSQSSSRRRGPLKNRSIWSPFLTGKGSPPTRGRRKAEAWTTRSFPLTPALSFVFMMTLHKWVQSFAPPRSSR